MTTTMLVITGHLATTAHDAVLLLMVVLRLPTLVAVGGTTPADVVGLVALDVKITVAGTFVTETLHLNRLWTTTLEAETGKGSLGVRLLRTPANDLEAQVLSPDPILIIINGFDEALALALLHLHLRNPPALALNRTGLLDLLL